MLLVQMSLDKNYAASMQSPDQNMGHKLCQVRNREVAHLVRHINHSTAVLVICRQVGTGVPTTSYRPS